MTNSEKRLAHKLAIDHVDWALSLIRPLLISYLEHGFKHGLDYARGEDNRTLPASEDFLDSCRTIIRGM